MQHESSHEHAEAHNPRPVLNGSQLAVVADGGSDLAILDQVEIEMTRASEAYFEKWGRKPFDEAMFKRPRDAWGEQPSMVDALAGELGEVAAYEFEREQRARAAAYAETREALLRQLDRLARSDLQHLCLKGWKAREAGLMAAKEAQAAYDGFKEAKRQHEELIMRRLRGGRAFTNVRQSLELLARYEPLCSEEVESQIRQDLFARYETTRERAQPALDRAAILDQAWSRRLARERDERVAALELAPPPRHCRTCLLPVAKWSDEDDEDFDCDYCSRRCATAEADLVFPPPWTKNCRWCNRWFVAKGPLDHCSPLCLIVDAVDLQEHPEILARWPVVRYLPPPPLTLADRRKLGKSLPVQWELQETQFCPVVIGGRKIPQALARALPSAVPVRRTALIALLPSIVAEEAAARQRQHQAASDPVGRFLDLLRAALADGSAHIATVDGLMPRPNPGAWGWRADEDQTEIRPQGVRIGWIRGEDLGLEWDSSYAVAQRLALAQHEPLPVSRDTLLDRVNDAGLIVSRRDDEHYTTRWTVEGKRLGVVHLAQATLFPPPLREPMQ